MDEMQSLKRLLIRRNPVRRRFDDGQDAVNSAKEFHDKLALTGIVLTKMDGDAAGRRFVHSQGHGSLSSSSASAKSTMHRAFPSRSNRGPHSRHGRHSLAHRAAEDKIDKKKSEEFAQKALSGGGFSLADFRDQLLQVKKMDLCSRLSASFPRSTLPTCTRWRIRWTRGRSCGSSDHQLHDAMSASTTKSSMARAASASRALGHHRAGSQQLLRQYVKCAKCSRYGKAELRPAHGGNEAARHVESISQGIEEGWSRAAFLDASPLHPATAKTAVAGPGCDSMTSETCAANLRDSM